MTEIFNERLRESVWKWTAPNGLPVYVYPMPQKDAVTAYFAVNFGSASRALYLDGRPVRTPAGIAHFLEHKLFESEDGTDAFGLFARTGASANAYTSYERTCYLFHASSGVRESLEYLLDFVRSPYFTEQTVNKEMGIIAQEIRMYRDSADWRIVQGVLELLYPDWPVGMDIAGTVESIGEITPELLYECYRAAYRPENMVLAVAGNITPEEVREICQKKLTGCEENHHVELSEQLSPNPIRESRRTIYMDISDPQFCYGFRHRPFVPGERVRKECALDLLLYLLSGDTSPLYRKLYDKGLINTTFGGEFISGRDYLCVFFAGESCDSASVCSAVDEEIRRLQKRGVQKARFEECRRAFIADSILEFESAEDVVGNLVDAHFKNSSIYDTIDLLEQLTAEDMNVLLRDLFSFDNTAFCEILPINTEKESEQ